MKNGSDFEGVRSPEWRVVLPVPDDVDEESSSQSASTDQNDVIVPRMKSMMKILSRKMMMLIRVPQLKLKPLFQSSSHPT